MNKEQIINFISDTSEKTVSSTEEDLEFRLWTKEEIVSNNLGYNVEEFLPGHLGIGTSGGGEMLCVEYLSGKCFSVPFSSISEEDRIELADSIATLIR